VAARRGADLLRNYGQYHFLGKFVVWMQRSKVEAKYEKVTERLRGLMPAATAAITSTGGYGTPTSSAGGGNNVATTTTTAATPTSASPFLAHTSSGGAGRASNSGGGAAAAAGALERTVTGGSGGVGGGEAAHGGQLLRRGRHERVYAVSFAPPAIAAASGGMSVWWALESCVEFYTDATQSTTSFAIEGGVYLSCVAIDGAGNTWGGTNRGALLVRRPRMWDIQAEEKLFSSALRALAFDDESAVVWAGDEYGCLRSAHLHEGAWRIEPLLTALAGRKPTRGLSAGALLQGAR